MQLKNILLTIIRYLILLIGCVVLFILVQPWILWYINHKPALGVDLYNSVTNATFFAKHFAWWSNGFRDSTFSGFPLAGDFPPFQYYAMVPFVNLIGQVRGVQIYVSAMLFLLIAFSYLLFYKLSKNYGLAFFLSVLVFLSSNIYGSATWGGSLPYFSTQIFLPLTLTTLIFYFERNKYKWLLLSSLFAGIAFLSHPLPVLGFLLPSSILLIFTYNFSLKKKIHKSIIERIVLVIKFIIPMVLVAFVLFGNLVLDLATNFFSRIRSYLSLGSQLGNVQNIVQDSSDAGAQAIAKFYQSQVQQIFLGTNKYLFIAIGLGLIIFVLSYLLNLSSKKIKGSRVFEVLPFILIFAYTCFHVYYNLTGHNFFSQGLYRAFWPVPIVAGALASVLWRPLAFKLLQRNSTTWIWHISSIVFVILALFIYSTEHNNLLSTLDSTYESSSAFPESLNYKTSNKEQNELKKKLVPSFLDPNDKNKRIYISDAAVNLWWPAYFNMPLVRGYSDPPIGTDRRGGFFLTDISLTGDTLVSSFKYTPDMAKNYALFFADWYAVYYLEGGHLSPSANAGPSSYLADSLIESREDATTYGALLRYTTESGKPEFHEELPQSLVYYKFEDDMVSPVLYGTNAPTILVISDDPSFENIWRVLAAQNLNSRFVIPIAGNRQLDSYSSEDLKKFDAIILYSYTYNNLSKFNSLLKEYLENGGNIFVDTGTEVKDAKSANLAEVFPISKSERNPLSNEWNIEIGDSEIAKGIDFSQFSPPIYNDKGWSFSYPPSEADLKPDAKIIIKNQDKLIMAERSIGKGKIIWSGMNLPYHYSQYNNAEEALLFRKIIENLVKVEDHTPVKLEIDWQRPGVVKAQTNQPVKGILFKEEAYNHWIVTTTGVKGSAIFKTGPTFPGFIYVRMNNTGRSTVKFTFMGSYLYSLYSVVMFVSILLILEAFIFDGRLIGMKLLRFSNKARKKIFSWWEKETEDYE